MKIRDNYLEVSAPVGTSEKYIRDLIYENEEDLYARLSSYIPYFDLKRMMGMSISLVRNIK